MCEKDFDKCLFMLEYCLDKLKTHNMCKKVVDAYPLRLRYVPDLFVTSKKFNYLDNIILDNTGLYNVNLDERFT